MTTPATSPSASRVLIVDDEPAGRQVLEALLIGEGYELRFAQNGAEAIEFMRTDSADLVLLDVMMPGMDGFEVCRRLRLHPDMREVPIILITALDDRDSKLAGLTAGADDFMSKPFDRLELRARVRTVTRLNRYRKLIAERASRLESYERTLEGWIRALDLRDHETEGHTQRVTELTMQLARAYGVPAEHQEHVRRGALLHDIGKIGVSDSILRKPGPLTDAEWVEMRQHPEHAYQMLLPIEFLRQALDIPYCHHERWDGTGYPRGLSGDAIPLAARLFAVVDTYDALVSNRPYKTAWTTHDALARIARDAGSHFDPEVVKVFLEMMRAQTAAPPAVVTAA